MKHLLIFLCLLLAACGLNLHPVQFPENTDDTITVSVEGAVETPGKVEMKMYDTVDDLLSQVSLKEDADITALNRQTVLKDKDVVVIPDQPDENERKISINSADVDELILLPGIGRATAEKIVRYRDENGFFQTLEDLLNVKGIGEAKLEKMKNYISL